MTLIDDTEFKLLYPSDLPFDTAEAWESGALGRSLEHARVVSITEEEKYALAEAIGMEYREVMIDREVMEALKNASKLRSWPVNFLINQALREYLEKY